MFPGATELIVILVIVLIIFGPGKLPSVFKSFGEGIRNFKDAQRDGERSLDVTPEDGDSPQLEAKPEDAQEVAERSVQSAERS